MLVERLQLYSFSQALSMPFSSCMVGPFVFPNLPEPLE